MTRRLYHSGNPRPRPAWLARVRVGSVLRRGNGPMRVVRRVVHLPDGSLRSVTFTIKRCSWTRRCYTIYLASDLLTLGYRLVPAKPLTLRKRIDRKIAEAMNQGGGPVSGYILRCCDVESVP